MLLVVFDSVVIFIEINYSNFEKYLSIDTLSPLSIQKDAVKVEEEDEGAGKEG